MYRLINDNVHAIMNYLMTTENNHVTDYLFLINHLEPMNEVYQRKYRRFWRFRGMSAQMIHAYFNIFNNCLIAQTPPDIHNINSHLYAVRLDFSFATKMAHMIESILPIYDNNIATFYFFKEPSKRPNENKAEFATRKLDRLNTFYDFLRNEYSRIIRDGLLEASVHEFRQRYVNIPEIETFSETKIIDTFIWSYVNWLNNGALEQHEFKYQ